MNFDQILEAFANSKLAATMQQEVEGSPYHREPSVWAHTMMVLSELKTDEMVAKIAALFHDAGKPMSRIEKYSEERGDYRAYYGHDKASSRLMEDFFSSYDGEVDWNVVYAAMFLVEQHQCYKLEDPKKLSRLSSTLKFHSERTGVDMFEMLHHLMTADANGRLTDNSVSKLKMHDETDEFFERLHAANITTPSKGEKVMFILIGASGSGKSTLVSKAGYESFSLDAVRHQIGGDDYEEAFKYCCENKQEFDQAVAREFSKVVNSKKSFFLDNTNTTRKSRQHWIEQARRNGYSITAILFPVALDTVIARQQTRGDKFVPSEAVRRQYFGIDLPQIGDVDDIWIKDPKVK